MISEDSQIIIFHSSEAKNLEKQYPMYRFTKTHFKPMKSAMYNKRRITGPDFEMHASYDGNTRAFWQFLLG